MCRCGRGRGCVGGCDGGGYLGEVKGREVEVHVGDSLR